jgi:hypothetical protein
MDVKLACPAELRVVQASFESPNQRGHTVIKPGDGNLPGHYVSVPIVAAVGDWGLPLEIAFEPKEADITQVRMGLLVDGNLVMSDADLSSFITTRSAGRLNFANAVMPPMPTQAFRGKTSFVVELTGTLDGETRTSEAIAGRVTFESSAAFVPLFLAEDHLGSGRRYGQAAGKPEAGRDSWATIQTIEWLKASHYRFNDISALHVAQTSSGRSVLDHRGHSDGTQVDLRYADGNGGYADQLGGANHGAHIRAMLDAAAAAQAAGNGGAEAFGPSIAWVKANRAMLEQASSGARKMHAGDLWMARALLDGQFPDGSPIPGLTPWTSKPERLKFTEAHFNHWHISLKPN